MAALGSRGARELRGIARDLRAAAAPSGLRSELRRNITVAVQPMKAEVQRNAFNIPARGPRHTGLRVALMRATRVKVTAGLRSTAVRLMTDASRMPDGQQALPALMEGSDGARSTRWRKPVFGNRNVWAPQPSHPYFAPAVPGHLPAVNRGVLAAVDTTAARLQKGP